VASRAPAIAAAQHLFTAFGCRLQVITCDMATSPSGLHEAFVQMQYVDHLEDGRMQERSSASEVRAPLKHSAYVLV